MEEIGFSWDAKKAEQNLKKHKVSFDEASTVFYDESAIQYFDPDHSKDEDRFFASRIALAFKSAGNKLLCEK
jgi:hypothetical protein